MVKGVRIVLHSQVTILGIMDEKSTVTVDSSRKPSKRTWTGAIRRQLIAFKSILVWQIEMSPSRWRVS